MEEGKGSKDYATDCTIPQEASAHSTGCWWLPVDRWHRLPCTGEPHTRSCFQRGGASEPSSEKQPDGTRSLVHGPCCAKSQEHLVPDTEETWLLGQNPCGWSSPHPWQADKKGLCAHCQGLSCPVLVQFFPSHPNPRYHSQVAREAKTSTSGHLWAGPWLRELSHTSRGDTQIHGAGRRPYGPHSPNPQAVTTISSLKPQAADQVPQVSPRVHPKGQKNLWSAVFSRRKCVMRRKPRVKSREHIPDLHDPLGRRPAPPSAHCQLPHAQRTPSACPARRHQENPYRTPRTSVP